MGKAQKKKAVRRHNPVRVPDSHLLHGLASASSVSSKNEAILPIIQKLGSVEAAERIWACAAVCNLIQNDPSTRRLLQGKNIVGELITRLSDATEEVVVEAAGALRNLCIDGGYEICAEMYNKNIMAPLRTFPAKISAISQQCLEDPNNLPEGARRLVYEFAENVIAIFGCLSEASNKALKAVNDVNLVPFLISFLQAHERLPLTTVNAAAQCLYILTDDNDPAIDALRNESPYVVCLLDLAQRQVSPVPQENNNETRWTMLRVLASGILRNISPLPSIMPAASVNFEQTMILPLLLPLLSIDLVDIANSVTNLLSQLPDQDVTGTKPSLQHTPGSDHKTIPERQLEFMEEKLRLTQLTLEILTSVCAKLPEPESVTAEGILQDEDEDEDMDAENEDAIIKEPASPLINGSDNVSGPGESNNEIVAILTGPLLNLIHPTPLSFPPSPIDPSPHPPTTSALSTIHIRALEGLNNLFLAIEDGTDITLTPEDKKGSKLVWDGVWHALKSTGKVVNENKIIAIRGLERKKEMWDIAMGVLWGIARIGKGYLIPDPDQVQALMDYCDASEDDLTRVKCIGALECAAQNVHAVEGNKIIATYLLAQIASPTQAHTESCLQAASAMIDIYSDEASAYDINFREGGWIGSLEKALPSLRKLVRGIDRRKPGGMVLRSRGDEVVTNLAAFIKYRKGLKVN